MRLTHSTSTLALLVIAVAAVSGVRSAPLLSDTHPASFTLTEGASLFDKRQELCLDWQSKVDGLSQVLVEGVSQPYPLGIQFTKRPERTTLATQARGQVVSITGLSFISLLLWRNLITSPKQVCNINQVCIWHYSPSPNWICTGICYCNAGWVSETTSNFRRSTLESASEIKFIVYR
jgi:hypothetical protein